MAVYLLDGEVLLDGGAVSTSEDCCCECTGACCDGGDCTITTEAECAGTFQGCGTTCDPNPCEEVPTGACCDTFPGTCTVTTQADCEDGGGIYLGDNTDCDPNPCDADCCGESYAGFLGGGFYRTLTYTVHEVWACEDGQTGENNFSVSFSYFDFGEGCIEKCVSASGTTQRTDVGFECFKTAACNEAGTGIAWSGGDPDHTCFSQDTHGVGYCADVGYSAISDTVAEGSQACIDFPPGCETTDCCGYVTVTKTLSNPCTP